MRIRTKLAVNLSVFVLVGLCLTFMELYRMHPDLFGVWE